MPTIFLYGTLCHLPLLKVVTGRAPDTAPASLADHSVVWAAGQNFPIIRKDAGAVAKGIIIDVDEVERDRLSFYEGPYGYGLRPVEVETSAGPVAAEVYWPDPGTWEEGESWSLADWQREWGAIVTRAAGEVMAAFGLHSAEAVARRFGMLMARSQAIENTATWQRPRTVGRHIGAERVDISAQSFGYVGFFTMVDVTLSHPRIADDTAMHIDRAVFMSGEAISVLPYDPVRDRVLVVEQFRPAPFALGDPDPWLLEPVAGLCDAGETPEETARREAREEAGVEIGALHFISRYYNSPGATGQVMFSYVGMADLPDDLDRRGGLDHEGEDIAVHLLDFDDAMAMIESGEVAVAPLILTLQWLAVHRDRLRAGA